MAITADAAVATEPKVTGYVYFFRSPALCLVKIGQSTDPARRFASIRTHCPDLVAIGQIGTDDRLWLERCFHGVFADCRSSGEWFRLTDDDLSSLQSLPDRIFEVADFPEAFQSRYAKNQTVRFELRMDGLVRHRLGRQADRLGVSADDYLIRAATAQLEKDEATDPKLKD